MKRMSSHFKQFILILNLCSLCYRRSISRFGKQQEGPEEVDDCVFRHGPLCYPCIGTTSSPHYAIVPSLIHYLWISILSVLDAKDSWNEEKFGHPYKKRRLSPEEISWGKEKNYFYYYFLKKQKSAMEFKFHKLHGLISELPLDNGPNCIY